MEHLRQQMPVFGKSAKQQKLLQNMEAEFQLLSSQFSIAPGDFPPIALFVEKTTQAGIQLQNVMKLEYRRMEHLEDVFATQIPQLLKLVPKEEKRAEEAEVAGTQLGSQSSPFLHLGSNAVEDRGMLTRPDVSQYERAFHALGPSPDGLLSGDKAKIELVNSKLPSAVLHRIWNLSDITKDGCLDLYEFSLCKHFIKMKLDGGDLPIELPDCLLPLANAPNTPNSPQLIKPPSRGDLQFS
eukprot:GHVR01096564.1.p2 GENE.GHVR01096564.1~~GHVR01096564.1.p2  ORF type:complete len:240 (+),score=56.95 GHVR01096564.1:937-1656(+)